MRKKKKKKRKKKTDENRREQITKAAPVIKITDIYKRW